MNPIILVIDDDVKLTQLLSNYLKRFDFDVIIANHPDQGKRIVTTGKPDLVILDVMMPDIDGFTVCQQIRETSAVPIIILTARGDVSDRINGLELGADDYLPKPFEPDELIARIKSVLRRSDTPAELPESQQPRLSIDPGRNEACLNGHSLDLTTNEFEILKLFIENTGKILDREFIMAHIRGIEWDALNRSADVLVSRLRQKLNDDPKQPHFIKTIWGTGYKFIGVDTIHD
jgi:two-component system phosphate regulon response regulator OmpR